MSAEPVAALLAPTRLTAVVDIGANPIDGDPPYKAMLVQGLCTVVGFEPQAEALAALQARKGPNETYLPYALGDGQRHTLRLCRASGMSSLLKPNAHVLKHFAGFPDWGTVVREESIDTARLDDVTEIEALDFLKIDVQGSELSVFRGGRAKLAEIVALQTEISFLGLYEDQPTFGEVDAELRGLGFVPHAFAAINRRMIAPLTNPRDPYAGLNQLLEADIVYVRDFMRPEKMSDEQLKHLALIAHHAYGSVDLAGNCIFHLEQRKAVGAGTLQRYTRLIRR